MNIKTVLPKEAQERINRIEQMILDRENDYAKHTVCGEMYFPTTVITGKGQIWLLNKLKEEYEN